MLHVLPDIGRLERPLEQVVAVLNERPFAGDQEVVLERLAERPSVYPLGSIVVVSGEGADELAPASIAVGSSGSIRSG